MLMKMAWLKMVCRIVSSPAGWPHHHRGGRSRERRGDALPAQSVSPREAHRAQLSARCTFLKQIVNKSPPHRRNVHAQRSARFEEQKFWAEIFVKKSPREAHCAQGEVN